MGRGVPGGMMMNNEITGHNELVLEYNFTKNFLKEAIELGLAQATIILGDRESALRQATEKLKKSAA
jgi:hypothetical protein